MKEDIEQFEEAFSMHTSGSVAECACGRVFWDSYNSGYYWENGERERLSESKTATSVPHSVERVVIDGIVYCMDCSCWHSKAERIIQWLRDNQTQVGQWYALEKRRLQFASNEVPIIEHCEVTSQSAEQDFERPISGLT